MENVSLIARIIVQDEPHLSGYSELIPCSEVDT